MKTFFSLIFVVAISLFALEELDFSSDRNWIIREPDKQGMAYDLFYAYPTLSAHPERTYLDRDDENTMAKVMQFVQAQTGIVAAEARIFAPFIRQLEYGSIIKMIKDNDLLKDNDDGIAARKAFDQGVDDLAKAFEYYRKHYRQDRPFIFAGHSQGAMELYEMLRKDTWISKDNGFVAAYLIGIPKLPTMKIEGDFKGRDIIAAKGEEDLGVIVVWNTQHKDTTGSLFTDKGMYCINPLNWKTDGTPADKKLNLGAFFYDYRNNSTQKHPNFCGAAIDLEKGALIIDLPANSQWDANGFLGKGVFHMNDIWFFAENIRQNMLLRAKRFQAGRK